MLNRIHNTFQSVFLRSVVGTVFVQGASAVLIFLLSVALARELGEIGYGAYDFADTWIDILTLFAMLGFDRFLIKQVAEYDLTHDYQQLWSFLRYTWRHILFASVFLAILMAIIVSFVFIVVVRSPIDELYLILSTFLIAMLILPLRTLMKYNQGSLQGMKHTALAYLPDYVIRPLVLLIFIVLLSNTPQTAMRFHLVAAIIALGISGLIFTWLMPRAKSDQTIPRSTSWLIHAIPFMFISGINLLNIRGGVIVVGLVSNLETVAYYGIAVRVSGIIALMIVATSAVAAPRVARLYQAGEMVQLQRFITRSTQGIVAIAIPTTIILIIFGKNILALFKIEFVAVYYALIILCIGQIFNAFTGFVGWVMMMTGHERAMIVILSVIALIHMFLIFVLAPPFGVIGAAIATAGATIAVNVSLAIFVYYRIKLNASILPLRIN